jgi:hypothetical protein
MVITLFSLFSHSSIESEAKVLEINEFFITYNNKTVEQFIPVRFFNKFFS